METDLGFIVQRISEEKGIGVFAAKHYTPGEIIFVEKPIVSAQFAWNKEYKYHACDHCMRPLESTQENVTRLSQNPSLMIPLPELCPTNKLTHVSCPECGVRYCCESCKQLAWNEYHRTLCENREPLKTLYNAWMNIHYPPESASIELLIRIIAWVEQCANKEEAFQSLMQFSHETINQDSDVALKLLGKKAMDNLIMLQPILSQCIPTTLTAPLVTLEGLTNFFSLVGRNGQGIGTSVFSDWVKRVTSLQLPKEEKDKLDDFIDMTYTQMDKVVGVFLNCEGSGLFKLQRCLNHSCMPNAEVTFPDSNYVINLVATNDITPGEEICISYLEACTLNRSRHSRNKILRDYYLFECCCLKCINDAKNELDETSDDDDEDFEDGED